MNIQSKLPTTPEEFLRWNEGREGKREFVQGRVVELMINVTKRHALIAARLLAILMRTLQYPPFTVGTADFAIRTPDGVRYPDVFVDRDTADSKGTDLAASEPLLLAEILSPSSTGRDFVEKLADYQGVPSLLYYLVLSQEEPRAWLWSRSESGDWCTPAEIAGQEGKIALDRLGVTVEFAELYGGIER
jgi:Uma2 family endonuclease